MIRPGQIAWRSSAAREVSPQCAQFEVTRRLLAANPYAKRFYDVNLRPRCYTPVLVAELLQSADVVKLNEQELAQVEQWFGKLDIKSLCVTHGEKGGTVQLGRRQRRSTRLSNRSRRHRWCWRCVC